eukprot:9417552-Pyramimonas_sp.AAC.1
MHQFHRMSDQQIDHLANTVACKSGEVKLWTIYFNNVEAIKPERIIPYNGKNQWVSFNLSEAAIANKGAADLFKKMAQAATSPDPAPEPSELVEAAPAPFALPVKRPVDLDGEELCPSAKSAKSNKAEEVLGDGGAAAGSTTEQSGMEQDASLFLCYVSLQ